MAFARPALADLIDRIAADLAARFPGADVTSRRAVLWVLAKIEAAAAHGAYGYLDWVARQILPDQADSEILDRHGATWGVIRTAGAYAAGMVTVTGNDGATVPIGAALRRADGIEYAVDADVAIVSGSATVTVVALDAGADGNAPAGTPLTFVSPVSGIDAAAVVASGTIDGGLDTESDAGYRARILARVQSPPHGGNAADYKAWALEVPGVTRAWVSTEYGAGSVTVRFAMDGARANGIPLAGDVTLVAEHIEPLRPVAAELIVQAPTAAPLSFTIRSLEPATAAVRAAIEAELRDIIVREGAPGQPLRISRLREAVSSAAGEENHYLDFPTADVSHATGALPVFGSITWTP